jgi:hypothetical protein
MAASSNLPVLQSADSPAQETGPRLPSQVTMGPRLPSPVTQGTRLPSPVTQGTRLPSPVTKGPSLASPWPSQSTHDPTVSLERQAVSASVRDYSLEDFIFLPSQIEPVGKLTSTSLAGAGEAAQEAVLYPRYNKFLYTAQQRHHIPKIGNKYSRKRNSAGPQSEFPYS